MSVGTSAPSIPVTRPWLGEEEAAAAAEVVASGWVAQGPRVAEFEERFAAEVQAEHAVAVSSCTTALHLALVLAGVGPGDDVVVPSLSFIATANVVRHVGARPVFADVDPDSLAITSRSIEEVLTRRTRAVLLVHQVGIPADLDDVADCCRRHGLELVEDAACAVGTTYRGRPVGGHTRWAAFSFHPRKVITTGEGGMLTLSDPQDAARARRLREHAMSVSAAERHATGATAPETYDEVGFNYRMTDVQAAIGLVQMGRLPEILRRRRALAGTYDRELSAVPGIRVPAAPVWGRRSVQSYWVELEDGAPLREDVLRRLAGDGVSARRGIMAAHKESAYSSSRVHALPVTDRITSRSLILPLFPQMAEVEQERVVESLREAAAGG